MLTNQAYFKKYLLFILIIGPLTAILYSPPLLKAQDSSGCPGGPATCASTGGVVNIPNPLGENITPAELAGRVIKTILGVSGAAALVIFIYGGIMFMFSGGNETRVKTAKNTLVYATLGLAIIFASYAILRFVLEAISKATGSG